MKNLTEISILVMLAIIMLQSGVDKLTDRKGNLDWMTGHFAKSPLRSMVPMLLSVVTIMELAAGVTAVLGAVTLFTSGNTTFAELSCLLSIANFMALLFGQRMAKDYVGAQTIVIHLIPTIFLMYLLTRNI